MSPAHQREGGWFATWRSPRSFTALVPIPGGDEERLRTTLAEVAGELQRALRAVNDLHSLRLVVVPATTAGMQSLHLLFNVVHDRAPEHHFAALLNAVGPSLLKAFAGAGVERAADLPALWRSHQIRHKTMHLGALRRTVADILRDQALREEMGDFADRALANGSWQRDTPAETIREEIREHVLRLAPDRGLPSAAAEPLSFVGRALEFVDLLKTFAFPAMGTLAVDIRNAIDRIPDRGRRDLTRLAYRLWWVYAGIPTGIAYLGVRWLELTEPDIELPAADVDKVERLEGVEDIRLKNEVTYWFTVKETWFRRQLMTLVLWGSEGGCRHLWTNGKLAGIDTIHYARLLQIADRRVMLFMSDYDGSLDRYLLDFMGVGSRAVIPISSSVKGCPKTRWLYEKQDPATFGGRLRNLLRTYQLETAVWYNAYPQLTVRDVLVNAKLRDGLFAPAMTEESAQEWAELL